MKIYIWPSKPSFYSRINQRNFWNYTANISSMKSNMEVILWYLLAFMVKIHLKLKNCKLILISTMTTQASFQMRLLQNHFWETLRATGSLFNITESSVNLVVYQLKIFLMLLMTCTKSTMNGTTVFTTTTLFLYHIRWNSNNGMILLKLKKLLTRFHQTSRPFLPVIHLNGGSSTTLDIFTLSLQWLKMTSTCLTTGIVTKIISFTKSSFCKFQVKFPKKSKN